MNEFGVVYNNSDYTLSKYFFCAFIDNKKIFVSDALNNRLIIFNTENHNFNEIRINGWFPHWIQPIGEDVLAFVDSKKKTIGLLHNNTIIKETTVPMVKPKFVKKTKQKTFLVGGEGKKPLIEYDCNLNIIGKYLNHNFHIQSAEYIGNKLLICDIEMHQIMICDKQGNIFWTYGKSNYPGNFDGELSTPKYVCFRNGLYYIADSKNNRIICINAKKEIKFIYKLDEYNQALWWPCCLDCSGNELLITDSANCRVILLSLSDFKSRQFGFPKIKEFHLNNPRGIEIADDCFFVADTYNNRIMKFNWELEPTIFYGGKRGTDYNNLFWPRAIRTANNRYYIADSRNSRIIILDKNKSVLSILYGYAYNNRFQHFVDPHDIDVYDDKILITDSFQNKVIETDIEGKCSWIYGINGELNDPHNARKTIDNNYLISDTRNNRVIKVSNKNEIIYDISKTSNNSLRLPRWSEEINENVLITDSGNNRVILVTKNGKIIKQYGQFNNRIISEVRAPRCARKHNNHIIISDTYNNRIIITDY